MVMDGRPRVLGQLPRPSILRTCKIQGQGQEQEQEQGPRWVWKVSHGSGY